MKVKIFLAQIFLIVFACSSLAADWPQWQGPDRNAISPDKGLLQKWPKDGPSLAWKAENLGGGDSAPAVADGRLYLMSNRGDDELVLALSEKDGKEIWVKSIGPAVQQRFPQSKEGPGCTPAIDGDRLYVLGMGGTLACLQLKDGKIIWQKSLTEDFAGSIPPWSYRESPLVDGDKILCTPGGEETTIVALNKLTGEKIWQSKVPDPPAGQSGGGFGGRRGGRGGRGGFASSKAGYSSVIAVDFGGLRQYVQLTAKTLVGIDASDGKVLWRYDKPANGMGINCSTPFFHDGHVFAASAYGAGGGMVKLSKTDDGIKAEEAWFSRDMENHHGGVVIVDGCLYGANGGNSGGYLTCLDFKTGNVLWSGRDTEERIRKGSLAVADNRLYYRTEDGTVLLIEPNSGKYIEKGRFEQPDRRRPPAWAHPVVANGKLYIRDQDLLFCYDVKAK